MMYSRDHYCPFCWENDRILRMVYFSPDDETDLMCDIHGHIYEVDCAKNSYVKIDKQSSLIGEAKVNEPRVNNLTLFL